MLNSTDKFLVNDGSVTETVNWSDIQSEAFPMTVNVVLTPDEPQVGEAVTATPVTVGGDAPYTYTYQWVTADNALGLNETEIVGATSNTYEPVSDDTNKFLGCVVVATDDAGNSSTGTGYATVAVELALVIAKPTVLTPEDGAGIGGDISYYPETSAVDSVEFGGSWADVSAAGLDGANVFSVASSKATGTICGGTNKYSSNNIFRSTDGGKTWATASGVNRNSNGTTMWVQNQGGGPNGLWLAAGPNYTDSSFISYSTNDGESWSSTTMSGSSASDGGVYAMAYSPEKNIYVAVGGSASWYSTGGTSWSKNGSHNASWICQRPYGITYAHKLNKFIGISNKNNLFWYTEDGQTWYYDGSGGLGSETVDKWTGVAWSEPLGKFVVCGRAGTGRVVVGTDITSSNMTISTAYDAYEWESVVWNDELGLFIMAGGDEGGSGVARVATSSDGETWDIQAAGAERVRSVAVKDGYQAVTAPKNGVVFTASFGTVLNFVDNKAYNSADNSEVTTIDKVFKAGDKVVGEGNVTFADTLAFSTTTYTGDGNNRLLETGIDNTEKALIWFKIRNEASTDHRLNDSVVLGGGPQGKFLSSNSLQSTATSSALQSYETNGVQVNGSAFVNSNGKQYVAWNFRAAPGFLDIVSYLGNNTVDYTIPHALSSTPGMIITKATDDSLDWIVWHKDIQASDTSGDYLKLNSNDPKGATNNSISQVTSTDFKVGGWGNTNRDGKNYVSYVFGDTPGLIKCGKYSAGASGQTITTGFNTGWVLIKSSDGAENWQIFDSSRPGPLYPNLSGQETSDSFVDLSVADGFRLTTTNNSVNGSGLEYIYVAIAEDASAGEFMPTGVLTEDAAGTSMKLTDVTGEWVPGLTAVNETEATESAPGADDIVFTSSKPAITSGTVNAWGAAEWELSVDSGFVDKQESSVFLADSNPELGPTNFVLEDDTEYWVRTRYNSGNPEAVSEWSESTKFKTSSGNSGAFGNFSTTLYTGTGSAGNVVDGGIEYTDKWLIWQKNRSQTGSHLLTDSTMEKTTSEYPSLRTNTTGAQSTTAGPVNISGSTFEYVGSTNDSGQTHVVWSFKAAPQFFDVVAYTGENSGSGDVQAVPHSLGVEPGMMIVKRTNDVEDWGVYHKEITEPEKNTIKLNSDAVAGTAGTATAWGQTAPTASEFYVGRDQMTGNTGNQYIAYLFADNPAGGIKCGKFNGGGVANTTTIEVNCGFKAGWVLWKSSNTGSGGVANWSIYDLKRGMANDGTNQPNLVANNQSAEATSFRFWATDTGFAFDEDLGGSSAEHIFVAIADTTVTFYDEVAGAAVTNHTLTRRYGVDPLTTDLKEYGIYPLTEQPSYAVAAYVRENGHYKPIRSYLPEVNRTNQAISDFQASFEARIAALESEE